MKYRVLRISNNLKDYPKCESDTKEFPQLVEYVEDEQETFIIDENNTFWKSDDFFHMIDLKEFIAEN